MIKAGPASLVAPMHYAREADNAGDAASSIRVRYMGIARYLICIVVLIGSPISLPCENIKRTIETESSVFNVCIYDKADQYPL